MPNEEEVKQVLVDSHKMLDEIETLSKSVPPWILRRVKKLRENLTWIENNPVYHT